MTSRTVLVGKREQIVSTRWVAGTKPGFTEVHEHVILASPGGISDTQRLRLMTAREAGRSWS
jgi:hypothetical protein